ncbi:MAG: hypothetical protein SVR08_12860, partial [Spirochaetota bacterium]|nr:hypothetical protein [Spirochaetota bacterium]
MKKFRILLIVVLCLIFCSFNGFSSQRYNWWNNRLKMLNVQKNDIIKDNKEWGQVIGLINNDIERAKKILILIDKKSGEKDPTKYMNRKYTNAKIGELVNNILYPLFSLYYYEYLLKELGNRETYEHAKDVVHNYLQTSSKELWESIDEDKINQIIYENINKTDWKFLSIEIFLGEIIMSKDNIFKKVKSDIEKNVDKELAQRDYIISQVELRDKVITCFNEYIKKINIKNELCNSQEAFLASWSWNGISKGVLNKFRYYMEIINMYQKYSEISVNAVDPFYDNPEKLEQQLFKSIRKAHLDLRSLKKVDTVNEKKNVNQYILKIPEDPDIIQLFNDMDSIRLNALSRITGQEKGNFFEELDTKIDITIDKHLNSTKEEFKQEDKKLIAEIEKMVLGIVHKAYSIAQKKTKNSKLDANKHKLVILNENEYKEAKSIFKDKISHVNQYKQESIKFIRCISGAKKTSKDKILEANRSYGNRNHYYLNFVLSQIRKIAEIDNQRQPIHKRFVTVVRSTNNLLNAIGYSIRLDKTVLLQLNDEEYEKVKNIRMQVASELKNTRSEIKKIYSDMVRNKEKARIRLSSAEIQMKDRIAKLEVEYIHEKILESRKLYKEQNYSNSAFKKYFDTYNELIKKAQ